MMLKKRKHLDRNLGICCCKCETPLAEDYVAVEVSPTKDAETSLTIMAKEFIEKYSPEVNLGTPSLMFKEKTLMHYTQN